MKDDLQLWQQQPGEPSRWYSRFHKFLLMGPRRSLLRAYNSELEESSGKQRNSTPSSWDSAAKKWQWRDRAAAWDAFQQQREEQEWQIRRREQRELEWQVSQQLFQKAQEMLDRPLEASRWVARDASSFLEVASRLGRTASELYQGDLNAAIALCRKYGFKVIDETGSLE